MPPPTATAAVSAPPAITTAVARGGPWWAAWADLDRLRTIPHQQLTKASDATTDRNRRSKRTTCNHDSRCPWGAVVGRMGRSCTFSALDGNSDRREKPVQQVVHSQDRGCLGRH